MNSGRWRLLKKAPLSKRTPLSKKIRGCLLSPSPPFFPHFLSSLSTPPPFLLESGRAHFWTSHRKSSGKLREAPETKEEISRKTDANPSSSVREVSLPKGRFGGGQHRTTVNTELRAIQNLHRNICTRKSARIKDPRKDKDGEKQKGNLI